MSLFNEKVKVNKVLWKELIIGVVEAFIWCTILFLLLFGYGAELIEMLEYMTENVEVWSVYFAFLPIFIIIGVLIKLGFFVIKYDAPAKKHVAKPAAKTTTAKKTTTKKKTTKK